jgi:ABC-type transporter Mla subunit MlaD
MKKKIIYGLLFAVAMVTASSSFVSCKDYEGDDYAQLKEENLSLRDALNNQATEMQNYVLKTTYATDTTAHHLWNVAIENSLKALNTFSHDSIYILANQIAENNKAIVYVTALAKADSTRSWNDSIRIDALEQALTGWGDDLTEAVKEAAKVAATVAADSAKWNSTSETVDAKSDLWNKAVEVADSAWEWINKGQAVDRNGKKFNDLQSLIKAYEAADDALQEQINQLKKDVDNIIGTLKKQITGIIVQGTYSPVFGYGSLPLGIQTNILAAYAGKATADVQFPSAMKSFDNRNIITEADLAWLEGKGVMPASENITSGQLLFNDEKGNAGKMFLTVNPTNVDFSGTDFKLVNSKGYESRIQLSTLDASDEVLTFGWTRGTKVGTESDNGFYEVTATISKDDALKMQPDFDKAGFKNAVQAVVNNQARLAVKEAARALFNSLQPAERFGVKAEWTDTVGKRSVTSAFDVAALSIEPLGFGFKLPSSKYTRIPTINSKVIADKLHINLTIDPIVITEYDKATGKYVVKVEVDAKELDLSLLDNPEYKIKYYTYEKKDDPSSMIEVALVDVEKLLKDPNFQKDVKIVAIIDVTPMFEEMFGQFNATFTKFNDAIGGINKTIDDVAASVNSYIDRANNWINRINSVLDNLGNAVQPVLIWSDGKNAGELGGFVSANYAVGTVVPKDGQLALIPTSYSLELFAPAYKKSLIVTNAYKGGLSAQSGKDINLEEAVVALNKDLKAKGFDVFSSNSLKNQYIFNAKGYEGITFEIAYTAVDYEGKIAGRKFYLTVGE